MKTANTSKSLAITDQLKGIDQAIRRGNSSWARKKLLELARTPSEIPRAQLGETATLCRRAGLQLVAISLLHPYVRPKARGLLEASPFEKAEYAASLIHIGAGEEALQLLAKISGDSVSSVHLFRAFGHFAQWRYRDAIPCLKEYLHHPSLSDYQREIGRVNLAAALVIEREYEGAQELLSSLVRDLEAQGNLLLLANALEISAQNEIQKERFPKARDFLERAGVLLGRAEHLDNFWVEKWNAVLNLRAMGDRRPLRALRERAKSLEHWETLRECDFFEGLALKSASLLKKVYCGTPYQSYRQRIQSDGELEFSGRHYDWKIGASGPAPIFDISRCSALKENQVPERLLRILSSDFYKPFHLVSLYAKLFPERFFNPQSSPQVIHQAIKRLRQILAHEKVSLQIFESSSTYRLTSRSGPTGVTLRISDQPKSEVLIEKQGLRSFSSQELAKVLKLSKRSANRTIQKMLEGGKLSRIGNGPRTRYQFSNSNSA